MIKILIMHDDDNEDDDDDNDDDDEIFYSYTRNINYKFLAIIN